MTAVLVDSNVILDIFEDDEHWADWSESMLDQYADSYTLSINPVIYAEVSVGFAALRNSKKHSQDVASPFYQSQKKPSFSPGKPS